MTYLIVDLAGEAWAFAADAVQEVLARDRVPETVTLVDLAERFGFAHRGERGCVVVTRDGATGFVVDGALDVVDLRADEIESPPDLAAYLGGFFRRDDSLVVVLNVEELI